MFSPQTGKKKNIYIYTIIGDNLTPERRRKCLCNGVGGNDLGKLGKNFGGGQPLTEKFLAPFFSGAGGSPAKIYLKLARVSMIAG